MRLPRDSLLDQRDAFVREALRAEQDAQQVQRVGIAGMVRQDRYIQTPSVSQRTGLVQGDGLVELAGQRNPPPPFT